MKRLITALITIITVIGISCSCKNNTDFESNHQCNGTEVIIKADDSKDNIKDGWNLYGWLAFVISFGAGIISYITYTAQKETERHTKNAPLSVQVATLTDLHRHLYRNLVCSCAAINKYRSQATMEKYPSESNMLKLKTLPDDILLSIDADKLTYKKMHEYKLLLRNYNLEIQCSIEHLSKKGIDPECLKEDFDNLLFKPLHLISESINLISLVKQQEEADTRFYGIRSKVGNAIEALRNKESYKDVAKKRKEHQEIRRLEGIYLNMVFTILTEHINKIKSQKLNNDYKKIEINKIDAKNGIYRSFKNLTDKAQTGIGNKCMRMDKCIFEVIEKNISTNSGPLPYKEFEFNTKNFLKAYEHWWDEENAKDEFIGISMDTIKNYYTASEHLKQGKSFGLLSLLTTILSEDVYWEQSKIGMINY